jgi:hypothetical protein
MRSSPALSETCVGVRTMGERLDGGVGGISAAARTAGHDLSVREAAWVLGESAGAVRRMCEQGLLGAWRVVDPSGSSARLRWHVPSEALAPLLCTELARRRLRALVAGEVSAPPRSPRRESASTPAPLPAPGSLLSIDLSSDNHTDQRSDTVLSQDRVVREHSMIDNVSEEAP